MKLNVHIALLISLCIVGGVAVPDVYGQDSTEQLLEKAYGLMESVFVKRDFIGGDEARSFVSPMSSLRL